MRWDGGLRRRKIAEAWDLNGWLFIDLQVQQGDPTGDDRPQQYKQQQTRRVSDEGTTAGVLFQLHAITLKPPTQSILPLNTTIRLAPARHDTKHEDIGHHIQSPLELPDSLVLLRPPTDAFFRTCAFTAPCWLCSYEGTRLKVSSHVESVPRLVQSTPLTAQHNRSARHIQQGS